MKPYHKNPRIITEIQASNLQKWLQQYGDLSGIVHDLNSDQIIGGNQRSTVFNINQCKIILLETFIEPDDQGTVGIGYVIWQGKKYAYRQVRWSPEVCEQANLIANKAGGSFDYDILANQFDLGILLNSGFEKAELGIFENLPSLDDLAQQYGAPAAEDFWPVLILKLPSSIAEWFRELLQQQGQETDAENFAALFGLNP